MLMIFALAAVLTMVLLLYLARKDLFLYVFQNPNSNHPTNNKKYEPHYLKLRESDLYKSIPYYVDLNVGDRIKIVNLKGNALTLKVSSIDIDRPSLRYPRTRVGLSLNDEVRYAYCGMRSLRSGGIAPIEVEGVKIGVEITRLLFSEIKRGRSRFNSFGNFRLQGDVRLAVWSASKGIIMGIKGKFPVKQPTWSRNEFGNWLHRTNYGLHSAIDIFATTHGIPQEVRSPVNGTVYRAYNPHASPDDRRNSKAINIYADFDVGPRGEKMLFRFHHFSQIFVSDGDNVKSGQVIGLTGHTGFDPSIGDHLHFEIRLNPSHFGLPFDDDIFATVPVNPYYYLLEWYNAHDRQHVLLDTNDTTSD